MRTLPLAVVVSAALHGGAIAYVETRPHPKPEPLPRVTTIEIVPPADPEPMVVALLDDHTPVKPLPLTGLKNGKTSSANRATTQGGQGLTNGKTSSPGIEVAPSGPPGHSPLMGMRGAGDHDPVTWTPSAAFGAAFEANAKPPDIPPPPSGELHPSGNGTFRSDHPTFKVRVDRDGTAHLDDKPDVGDFHASGLGIAGRMSFDDWAMRKAGIDPYASAKRQWLDKTRDERARIGMASRKEDLARASEFVERNLASAWSRTASDPVARKQALFELWDDCAETGDDDLVAAGKAARAYVLGFVRAHLAPGQPGAFTADDLARLNAHRRSKAAFEPY